jgi:hypothetical protein
MVRSNITIIKPVQSSKPISDNDQDTQKTVVPVESGQKMP